MKVADLYIRVSTDEQADKGYSQRGQEEVLKRYCEANNIQVRRTIFEDHSAKTFIRPQWQALLDNLKRRKGQIDFVLFTKWDRFSRNAPDAYQMIFKLQSLGVEPQAIEQPLDMSVPENKMMLAIYLTAPEIENDRRALNTFFGMRRARKEGRWMSQAPIGYKNKYDERGKKYIDIDPAQADIIKWAFEEIAKRRYSTEQVFLKAREMGLKCTKNNFWFAIRNPVYCGRILIVKYKDEDAHTVKGLHTGIISEALFYEVQDALDGKKRVQYRTKMRSPDKLPLKGFIKCSKCTRVLCGSASKGRSQYYHYYHCSSACGCRFKAEGINEMFEKNLANYTIDERYAELFIKVIVSAYHLNDGGQMDTKSDLVKEMKSLNERLTRSRDLLLDGVIESNEYKAIKAETEQKVEVLELKLAVLAAERKDNRIIHIEPLVRGAILNLTRLQTIYLQSDSYEKKELIGSMYPEKFTLEQLEHRTAPVGEFYNCIYQINSKLKGKKNGQAVKNLRLPSLAPEAGLEPATL